MRRKLNALTVLRFFAALYVVFFHYEARHLARHDLLLWVCDHGYVAVSFFFALSGFVLSYAYGADLASGTVTVRAFLIARFARIYPLFVLTELAAAACLLTWTRPPPAHLAVAEMARVAFVTWIPQVAWTGNGPAWSIGVEAFFYAIFPSLALLLFRGGPRSHLLLLGIAAWGLGMLALLFFPLEQGLGFWATTIRFSPLVHVHTFVVGASAGAWFVADCAEGHERRGTLISVVAIVLLVAVVTALGTFEPMMAQRTFFALNDGLLAPVFALLLYALAHDGGVSRRLAWRPLVALGEASYALYLLQMPLHVAFAGLLHAKEGNLTAAEFCAYVVVLVAGSLLVHRFVELPARTLVREWLAATKWAKRPSRWGARRARLVLVPVLAIGIVQGTAGWVELHHVRGVFGATSVDGVGERGFSGQEESSGRPFRWTDGNALLDIPLPAGARPTSMVVDLAAGPPVARLEILANGRRLYSGGLTSGPWRTTLRLEGALGDHLVVELTSATFVPHELDPASPDERRLGVQVFGIHLVQ